MSCRVMRCSSEGTEVIDVRTGDLPIDMLVCGPHAEAMRAGEEWVWRREAGPFENEWNREHRPQFILMGDDLRQHNEWVVEEIGGLSSGGEEASDGAQWTVEIKARRRGTPDPETLRLVLDPHDPKKWFWKGNGS